MRKFARSRAHRIIALAGALLVSLALLNGAWNWYRRIITERHASEAEEMLGVVAQRAHLMSAEVRERMGDITILATRRTVSRSLDPTTPPALRQTLLAELPGTIRLTNEAYGYRSILLANTNLMPLMQSAAPSPHGMVEETMRQALARRGPAVSDPWMEPGGLVIYGLATPIFADADPQHAAVGVVYMERDITALLLSSLTPWPSPFPSLALNYIRAQGDEILYLELNNREDAAPRLNFSRGLAKHDQLATALLAMPGNGQAEATGRTPVPRVGTVAVAPNQRWRLIATVDAADIDVAINRVAAMVASVALALAAVLSLLGVLLWRREHRARLTSEHTLSRQYIASIQSMIDGFLRVTEAGMIDEANDALVAMTGYSHAALRAMPLTALAANAAAPMVGLRERARTRLHTQWRTASGRVMDVEGTATFVPDDSGGHSYLVVRDVTEERAAHRTLERLNNLHRLLNHTHKIIEREQDPEAIVAAVGGLVAVDPHILLAWTGWVDRAAGVVRILHASGPAAGYTAALSITLDPALPTSHGPSGRAIATGRIVTSRLIQADPNTQPWHAAAAQHGLLSSVAVPLTLGGQVAAILTLYSDEPDYFAGEVLRFAGEIGETISVALDAARSRELAESMRGVLEASETRLRRLLTASPVPTLIASLSTDGIAATNDAFAKLFGFPPGSFSTIAELHDRTCLDPDQRDALRAMRPSLRVMSEADLRSPMMLPEVEMRRADGSPRQVQGMISVIGDDIILAWIDLTELRQRERALRRREDIHSAIVEKAGVSITLIEETARPFVEFNTAAHERLGYSRAEFSALSLDAIVGPLDPGESAITVANLPDAGALVRRRLRHRDGHLIDVRTILSPLIIDGRRVVAAIWSDITEELASARALAAEAEKHRILFRQASHGVVIMRANGQVVDANARFLAMLRVPHAELLRQNISASNITPPDPASLKAAVEAPPLAEALLRRADGSLFQADMAWSLAELPDEELLYCSVIDITARKQTERELARIHAELEQLVAERTADLAETAGKLARESLALTASNDELRAIFAGAPIGIALLHQQSLQRSNPTLEAMFGYGPGEMTGMPASAWYASDAEYAAVDGRISRILAAGHGHLRHEAELVRKDGSRFWARLSGEVFNSSALQGWLLKMVEDITPEREAARAMVAAKEQAEAANSAKSTFLAVMSHEIRTPLNGVIGMSEILARDSLPPHQQEAVRIIHGSAVSLMGLIDDILDFSKIEADRVELEHTRLSLSGLVEGVCDSLMPALQARGVDLSLFIAPQAPEVLLADPTRLRQVLFNVIGNAVKFSGGRPNQRGRVAVRVDVARQHPLQLRFQVTDNGIGMSPEVQARLFTPFTQAEPSTTRRFGGSGLGLAITRRLLDRMHGEITAASVAGQGATFTITIPLEAQVEERQEPPPDLSGLGCVILAEDPLLPAADLAAYLAAAGMAVQPANSAQGAAEAAAATAGPCVVIHSLGPVQPGVAPVLPAAQPLLLLRRRAQGWVSFLGSEAAEAIPLGWLHRTALLRAVAVAAGRLPPSAQAEGRRIAHDIKQVEAPTIEAARAQGRLILLAEDDEINRKVILRQLNLLGHAAEATVNGREALEKWRHGHYALVLTDLSMPEMDGYALAAAIRQEDTATPPIPILALSANALRGEAELARERGFDQYLTKPIMLLDLQTALDRSMPAPSAPAAPAPAPAPAAPPPPPEPPAILPVLDLAVLAALVGDEAAVIDEFLADYSAATIPLAAQLRAAASAGDAATCCRLAHRLKSSSRSIGALALGALCAALEAHGKANAVSAITQMLPEFESALAELQARILAHQASPVAPPPIAGAQP